MAFILSENRSTVDQCRAAFARYREYLRRVEATFPPSAFALAASEWYFDPSNHQCPHDAWLESVLVSEPAAGDRFEKRTTSIEIRLLAAYHDGLISLRYSDVSSYSLASSRCLSGIGDWLYDEFRLGSDGNVIHEIEWASAEQSGGPHWIIESRELSFSWTPRPTPELNDQPA